MKKQRIMLMSGFLGSGKTTSMTALAETLQSQGKKACLITNDLGSNLVDTTYVERHGIPVLEISNGCLCHDVDQLVEKIESHKENDDPDIIIFEPVGSCVDMVRNVYRDVNSRFKGDYVLAPVSAIVDPIRYKDVYINGDTGIGAGEVSVVYGFKKQLEEADVLLINKIDMLNEKELAEIKKSIGENFPGVPVIEISALEGKNIDKWADYVMNNTSPIRSLDIDMDVIYKGCEEMGWFNKTCDIEVKDKKDIRKLCEDYIKAVKVDFAKEGKEILHLKVSIGSKEGFCKSALTSTDGNLITTGTLREMSGKGEINVNIRALMMPDTLAKIMEGELERLLGDYKITMSGNALQSFLPVEEPPEPVSNIRV